MALRPTLIAAISDALLLGLVQGVTEFLPVSSTGHLIAARRLLGVQPDPARELQVDVALHLGTLGALATICGWDWLRAATAGAAVVRGRRPVPGAADLALLLLFATLPPVLVGGRWPHLAQGRRRELGRVGAAMAIVGVALALAEHRTGTGGPASAVGAGLWLGLAQAAALVPGVSRSGATIAMGLLLGMDRATAVRTSFTIAGPVIGAAVVKQAWAARGGARPCRSWPAAAGGIVAAFGAGQLTARWLLSWVGEHRLLPFALYRVAVGLVLLAIARRRDGRQ